MAAQTLRAERDLSLEKPKNKKKGDWRDNIPDACCVDFSWVCCADSLLDGSVCEAASCAESGCAHGACADASCGEAACGCHSCW